MTLAQSSALSFAYLEMFVALWTAVREVLYLSCYPYDYGERFGFVDPKLRVMYVFANVNTRFIAMK